MSRGVASILTMLALLGVLLPEAAPAQPSAPLTATLFFEAPPPNLTYDATTPIRINLLIRNVSGAPVITTEGFSATDFWRLLYFELEGVGIITNPAGALGHGDTRFGTCHFRGGAIVPAIQVVLVEVLPGDFALQFTFDDARSHFDLTRPGRYTVTAKLSYLTYEAGAIITNCDIEFKGSSLLSIGAGGTVGRQEFDVVSNALEFFIAGDTVPPTTTVLQSPAPNGAGWNREAVALAFSAADDPGGSGVRDITVTLFGAQTGTQTIAGPSGSVGVTAEGTTTAFFNAEDNAGNKEAIKSQTVRIDRTAPVVTPPGSITVVATEAGGARGSASGQLATFLGAGSAVDNLDPSPGRLTPQVNGQNVDDNTLFPPGSTAVAFRFQDVAGNIGSASASVTVSTTTGTPAISAAIVGSGVQQGRVFYYDLKFTNSGTDVAKSVTLQQMTFTTLSGSGQVIYNPGQSPKLPVALGDLAVGASTTLRVSLTVPTAVTKFSMTESGQFKNAAGTTFSFSSIQTVTP